MRVLLRAIQAATACTVFLGVVSVRADVVTDWNETALQAIKIDKTSPPKAARALAIVHASIYDAVNGITQTHERYLVPGKPAGVASVEAAVAASARLCLVRLFPAQQASIDRVYERAISAMPNSAEKNSGIHWGEWTANLILVARSTDGNEGAAAYNSRSGPGVWEPTPADRAPALLPNWASVTCFTMTNGMQFRPVQPPALNSAVYAFDFNLTKQLGAKESTTRTAEQTAIAKFWADGPGTVTPPGHWNVIARDVAIERGTSLVENARLFALLNLALADAAICCWDCKYAVNLWRPVTAIHNADSDRNPATEPDPRWEPLLPTPPFPEYTSGHSTFSSAAATVLAAFFGSDNIGFSTTSEAMQGFSRTYQSFSEAAAEAGISRIYGGIHFMSANQQGLQSGARLGAYVVENFLKERPRLAANTPPAALAPGVPAALSPQTIQAVPASTSQPNPVPVPSPISLVEGPDPAPKAATVAEVTRTVSSPADTLPVLASVPLPAPSPGIPREIKIRPVPPIEAQSRSTPPLPPFPAPIPEPDLDRTAPPRAPIPSTGQSSSESSQP